MNHMEEEAEKELERRSKFLNSLIQKKKATEQEEEQKKHDNKNRLINVHVRACDMPLPLQERAFQCARDYLDSMPAKKLDSKHLALALKKEFDSSYGPAWHCIVGTSFGSYVTHSVGGFLYFSIDKGEWLSSIEDDDLQAVSQSSISLNSPRHQRYLILKAPNLFQPSTYCE